MSEKKSYAKMTRSRIESVTTNRVFNHLGKVHSDVKQLALSTNTMANFKSLTGQQTFENIIQRFQFFDKQCFALIQQFWENPSLAGTLSSNNTHLPSHESSYVHTSSKNPEISG